MQTLSIYSVINESTKQAGFKLDGKQYMTIPPGCCVYFHPLTVSFTADLVADLDVIVTFLDESGSVRQIVGRHDLMTPAPSSSDHYHHRHQLVDQGQRQD